MRVALLDSEEWANGKVNQDKQKRTPTTQIIFSAVTHYAI